MFLNRALFTDENSHLVPERQRDKYLVKYDVTRNLSNSTIKEDNGRQNPPIKTTMSPQLQESHPAALKVRDLLLKFTS